MSTKFGNTIMFFTLFNGFLNLAAFFLDIKGFDYPIFNKPQPNYYVLFVLWFMTDLVPIQIWLFSISYFQVTIDDNDSRTCVKSAQAERITQLVALIYTLILFVELLIAESTFNGLNDYRIERDTGLNRIINIGYCANVQWILFTYVGTGLALVAVLRINDLIKRYGLKVSNR